MPLHNSRSGGGPGGPVIAFPVRDSSGRVLGFAHGARARSVPVAARFAHGTGRGASAASGGGGLAVAVLALCGLRWLLRWRPRCGARRRVCCLGRRRLGRRCARSTRAALASTLAVATVWREAARVLPRMTAAWPSLCLLHASCAGFSAGGRHGVALAQIPPIARTAREWSR